MQNSSPERWWNLADRWFRLLEFCLLTGLLYYLSEKTDYILITILFWLSWVFIFWWILECVEYISFQFTKKKSQKYGTFLIWTLTAFVLMFLYMTIIAATRLVVQEQMDSESNVTFDTSVADHSQI